jgi:thiol-disulfide isomerase/thioredoxin
MNLNYPIGYLEDHDFNSRLKLINKELVGKPVFIMVQAGFCGYCDQAKPEFQRLAESKIITCATIQPDGKKSSEKKLGEKISKLYPGEFRGYPSYFLILPDGTMKEYEGGRDYQSMKSFIKSTL